MNALSIAETLGEQIIQYHNEIEDGCHDPYYDDYILDSLLEMQEVLMSDGTEEGIKYNEFMMNTDQEVKLFSTVKVLGALTQKPQNIKVMSIISVKHHPQADGMAQVKFLGQRVKGDA